MENLRYCDLDAFETTPLQHDPFPHFIIPNFIKQEQLSALHNDYPTVPGPGSYPTDLLQIHGHFEALLSELEGETFRAAVAKKFDIDLTDLPTLVTVRGFAQTKDGRIHTDTKSKVLTLLLYMNPSWETSEGRLRLLRDPKNIDSVITEIPPNEGTLLMFKVSPNSWHGHKPYEGKRRAIQLNYVTSESVVKKEYARHRFSAKVKRFKKFLSIA